jgi:hypothetical protein
MGVGLGGAHVGVAVGGTGVAVGPQAPTTRLKITTVTSMVQ